MKKILIFSLAYYPSYVSGAEAAIREITDRIDRSDIEFHLITLLFEKRAARTERIGNVIVHRVGFGGAYLSKMLFIPFAAITARRLDRHHHFDALWAMMTYMLFPTVLAKLLGVRAPHILTLQDGDPYEKVFERPFIRPLAPMLDYGFRTARMIQVISTYLGTWPAKRGYTGEIVLVPNGANPKDLKGEVPAEDVARIKEKLQKKEGDVLLVNTARLVHQKANDDTIRALALLPQRFRLVLVGGGPDDDMLRSLAKECGVADRVTFVGPVDRSEVTLYRKACDIFVAPSRSEGLGNAFLSAMASGLPVVATTEGGLAEFVSPETAWVVPKDSPDAIAAAVEEICAHPEDVARITSHAREMVRATYDWDLVARRMRDQVFRPVIG